MEEISPKSRLTTTLLAVFLGVFGIHRFYLDKTRTAVGMLVLGIAGSSILGTVLSVRFYSIDFGATIVSAAIVLIAVGTWAFVDFIFTVSGKMRDREGRLIKKW